MRTARYRPLIHGVASQYLAMWRRDDIDGEGAREVCAKCWLEGLILTESGGLARARRYEPHQDRGDRRYGYDPDTPMQDDGAFEDDASYRLMQVMGYNLRKLFGDPDHGGREVTCLLDYSWAYLPMANMAAGMRVLLADLQATGGEIDRALARYNGGPTGERIVDGKLRRQVYVEKVWSNALRVKADRECRCY